MRLRILGPSGKSSEIVVTGTAVRLGRDPDCEVFFDPKDYPMVSGEHARLERNGSEWFLTPLSRSNKTLLNDQPVEGSVKINKGDRIGLGYTGPSVEILAVGSTFETGPEPLGYVKDASAFAALPPAAPGKPQEKGPAPLEPTLREKVKQPGARPAPKPAAASRNPDKNRLPLPLETARFPKGMLWGALGATGILVVAAVLFVLNRGGTHVEPGTELSEGTGQTQRETKPEKKSVAALALALKDGPTPARKQALEELSRLGPQARPALAAVLDVFADTDPEMQTLAQQALTRMGPPTKNDVPIYAAVLRVGSPETRAYAAGRLAELGQQAKSELVFLRILSLDDDNVVKDAAQKAVLHIEKDLLAGLIQGIQDNSANARTQAARDLADMGAGAKAALPTLVEKLADSNSAVRVAVLEVFVAIGPDAVMVLGEALRDKNPEVRLSAINALGRMGPDARFVLPELIAVTFDPDAKTKEEALVALGRIGDYAIPYLVAALDLEKDLARRQVLVAALGRLGHDAGPSLQKALQSATLESRKDTAQLLDKFPSQTKQEERKDHTGPAGVFQNELRAKFIAADTNKDDTLDKEELARAYRGSMAKPYDYTPDGKPPRKFGAGDFAKYPDYAFLCRVDRDNDGKISRPEFERWAYDYALVMQKDQDERERIQKAMDRLAEYAAKQNMDAANRSLGVQERLAAQAMSETMRLQGEADVARLWLNYNNARRLQGYLYPGFWWQRTVTTTRQTRPGPGPARPAPPPPRPAPRPAPKR